MTDSRSIDLSIEVPGRPEEAWEAIATGPGVSSWFIPTEIEGRTGGEVAMDFGAFGRDTATVTAWDPPHRIVFQGGGDRPLAYEWLVEARDGGTCVVRLVNSGFGTGEEWDADYDGMREGWKIFLDNLRLHLTHFRGRAAQTIVPTVMVAGPNAAAWSALCSAIGVPEALAIGDRLATGGDGVPALAGRVVGTVRSAAVSEYLLLVDTPAEGTAFVAAEGDGDKVACSVYLYLYGEPVADDWTPWLTTRLQPVDSPAAGSGG
jgi:uncharacterized protein YndB with AHSA1/START domain